MKTASVVDHACALHRTYATAAHATSVRRGVLAPARSTTCSSTPMESCPQRTFKGCFGIGCELANPCGVHQYLQPHRDEQSHVQQCAGNANGERCGSDHRWLRIH